ncbi:PREDICTED: U-box domain-containing protein 38-like [Camelina sativa]|uniref:RING-type E3 ubiquitin transferase n=1 Tax=Camelina sativa TaxID=90675 RepID=A0ABM0XDK3_CAMSA|nr:PREDICTED: U-box domain-containing protein 38-like [Camelina sativa]XP_019095977.1 PREDICTED: U-box domain-containing protein 38-like [Camelina sativa]
MGKSGRLRWNPFSHRSSSSASSSSSSSRQQPQQQQPPVEFLCPISKSIMSDPVVVSSGQTFERLCVQVCRDLNFIPKLNGNGNDDDSDSQPDFSNIIPNLNMKSTIDTWCHTVGLSRPQPPDYSTVERNLRQQMPPPEVEIRVSEQELLRAVAHRAPMITHHADSELMGRRDFNSTSSSDESVIVAQSPHTPLPLTTRPACFSPSPSSSSSSAEIETLTQQQQQHNPEEEDEVIYDKLKSSDIFDQEQGLIMMRKMTRTKDEARVSLCSPRILSLLKTMIVSRYSLVQTNSLASLVNLSLDKKNKLTIVRLGFVPILIDVLKSGSREAQEHAAGTIFSLSLEDDNKMPIGVLGALQPLLLALRAADSDRTRHDSALALYHLSLNQTNRLKLVRLGAVPALFSMVRSGESASRALLVICNLACCSEGRSAMLDANAVAILVGMLREERTEESTGAARSSSSARENCVAALFALSHESLRFKGLAKEARAVDVLKVVEERGTERAREKAKKILQLMRERVPEDEEDDGEVSVDWNRVIDSNGSIRSRFRVGGSNRVVTQNSSGF